MPCMLKSLQGFNFEVWHWDRIKNSLFQGITLLFDTEIFHETKIKSNS